MSLLRKDLHSIKTSVIEMWALNQSQLEKTKRSIFMFNKDLAFEVIMNENQVNSFELKLDQECEFSLAVLKPVSIDLRFILAILKINSNLEHIGDISESIARLVIDGEIPFAMELLVISGLVEMFDLAADMLAELRVSWVTEDTRTARTMYKINEQLESINNASSQIIAEYIQKHPDQIIQCLYVYSMIDKLERIGDHSKNIAEEIVFFTEGKVLKHNQQAKKEDENA